VWGGWVGRGAFCTLSLDRGDQSALLSCLNTGDIIYHKIDLVTVVAKSKVSCLCLVVHSQ